jgi:YgiT-type zinc finger domain-containing protein
MLCLICRQTEITDGLASVSLQRGEINLIINNVPARICPSCGEAYIDEHVALLLFRSAREVSEVGILENVIEYNRCT